MGGSGKNPVSLAGRMLRSGDGKRIVRNFSYLTLLQLAGYAFPLITMPYLGRVLGVDKFGLLAIGTAIVAYLQSLVDYGFNYTAVKKLARVREDRQAVSHIVSVTLCTKGTLLLLALSLLGICTAAIPFLREHAAVIFATALILPGYALLSDWFFQAVEDMKYITFFQLLSKVIFATLVFVVIKDTEDYLWQPVLVALGTMAAAVAGLTVMVRRYGVRLNAVRPGEVWAEIRSGADMFISLFLPTIYTNLNTIILGAAQGKGATGTYNGASKFTSLAYSFFGLISRSVYPFFARRMDRHTLYVRLSLGISLLMSLGLFLLAQPLVSVFLGGDFVAAGTVRVLRVVALTPVAMSLTNSYGINYLVLVGKENVMRNIILVVSLLGIALGVFGALRYSFMGVAVASVGTQMLRALLITLFALRHKAGHQAPPVQ